MKPRKERVQMTVPMLTLATALHREGMSWRGCEIACQVIYGKSPGPSAFRSYLTDPQPRRKGAGVSRDPNRNGFPVPHPTPLRLSCVGNGANLASAP